jgi:hypothetical protein
MTHKIFYSFQNLFLSWSLSMLSRPDIECEWLPFGTLWNEPFETSIIEFSQACYAMTLIPADATFIAGDARLVSTSFNACIQMSLVQPLACDTRFGHVSINLGQLGALSFELTILSQFTALHSM